MKIKICGLQTLEDIQAVNEAKPDFCGFVIEVPKSRRSVSEAQVRMLVKELHPDIQVVGVFVNAPEELVIRLLKEDVLDFAQLHGQEDEEYMKRIRKAVKKPLIQAFSIQTREDVQKAAESSADYILLDQGKGGTGKTFDWSLVERISRDFFLAGGISAENLSEAAGKLHPWAVDLSSSVETDRKKDPDKIKQAVAIAREEN